LNSKGKAKLLGQQASIASDLASCELQLRPVVETESQSSFLASPIGFPCHSGMKGDNSQVFKALRKLYAKARQLIWKMRVKIIASEIFSIVRRPICATTLGVFASLFCLAHANSVCLSGGTLRVNASPRIGRLSANWAELTCGIGVQRFGFFHVILSEGEIDRRRETALGRLPFDASIKGRNVTN